MRAGLSLMEVVVALVILEIGLVGVAASFRLASTTLARAEAEESLVTRAEGAFDSLRTVSGPTPGGVATGHGSLRWRADSLGALVVEARTTDGRLLLSLPLPSGR